MTGLHLFHRVLPCLLVLALAACGDDAGADPAQAAASADRDLAALPAPAQSGGSVTGMPDSPGPGSVPLAGLHAVPEDAGAMVVPLAGVMPGDGGLPPLEDNPETGLGGVVDLSVPEPPALAPLSPVPAPPVAQDTRTAVEPAAAGAVAMVRDYYAAISRGDHARAYAMWSDGGRSSGQTPEQFAAGFAGTRVVVQPGEPGSAGANLVEVPVSVTTLQADGGEQRYVGTYVLRRAMADGSGAWRITSAQLREYQP